MSLPDHPLAQALLTPAEWLYRGAMGLRNRLYDRPGRVARAAVPVISVGNLTLGGTGKTPLVAWLARHLLSRGRRPYVVSRGYGGSAGGGPLVVSQGKGPLCDAARSGDEPWLLARCLPGVGVVVGSNRRAGVAAAAGLGADVAVLDDGFQHRRLARDLDVVLLDADNPFGNHRVLPAGRLREPLTGLIRADVVVITRSPADASFPDIEALVRRYNPRVPIVRAGHRAVGFLDACRRPAGTPRRAVAFCGIGNPERFRADLVSRGVEIVAFRPHRDHHRYTASQIGELLRLARDRDAALVTTEKDLARIGEAFPEEPQGPALLALSIEAVVHDPSPLTAAVGRALGENQG